MNQNFKEQQAEVAPPMVTTPAQAAPEQSCHEQSTPSPRKRAARSLQLSESTASISRGRVTRVLARLRDGENEEYVARKEGLELAQLRLIRKAYFAIVPRAMATVRMVIKNADELVAELQAADELIAELEQDVLEEFVA